MDPKDIVQVAMNLFWAKGYLATTMDDLDAATGLNRGSIYYLFGDKRALFLECLDFYAGQEIMATVRFLRTSTNGKNSIFSLFGAVVKAVEEDGDRSGCLLCNTASELGPHDSDVGLVVTNHLACLRDGFHSALRADDNGGHEATARQLADQLLAAYAGLHVMVKSGFPIQNLTNAAAVAKTLLAAHRSRAG